MSVLQCFRSREDKVHQLNIIENDLVILQKISDNALKRLDKSYVSENFGGDGLSDSITTSFQIDAKITDRGINSMNVFIPKHIPFTLSEVDVQDGGCEISNSRKPELFDTVEDSCSKTVEICDEVKTPEVKTPEEIPNFHPYHSPTTPIPEKKFTIDDTFNSMLKKGGLTSIEEHDFGPPKAAVKFEKSEINHDPIKSEISTNNNEVITCNCDEIKQLTENINEWGHQPKNLKRYFESGDGIGIYLTLTTCLSSSENSGEIALHKLSSENNEQFDQNHTRFSIICVLDSGENGIEYKICRYDENDGDTKCVTVGELKGAVANCNLENYEGNRTSQHFYILENEDKTNCVDIVTMDGKFLTVNNENQAVFSKKETKWVLQHFMTEDFDKNSE